MSHIYIVPCQRGGVSEEPPWLRAATRHGPLTLQSMNRWTRPDSGEEPPTKRIHTDRLPKIEKYVPTWDLFYKGRVSLARHKIYYFLCLLVYDMALCFRSVFRRIQKVKVSLHISPLTRQKPSQPWNLIQVVRQIIVNSHQLDSVRIKHVRGHLNWTFLYSGASIL